MKIGSFWCVCARLEAGKKLKSKFFRKKENSDQFSPSLTEEGIVRITIKKKKLTQKQNTDGAGRFMEEATLYLESSFSEVFLKNFIIQY